MDSRSTQPDGSSGERTWIQEPRAAVMVSSEAGGRVAISLGVEAGFLQVERLCLKGGVNICIRILVDAQRSNAGCQWCDH